MKKFVVLLAVLTLFPISSVFAQHDGMDMSEMNNKAVITEGIGMVDAVDKSKGMVTLSHEPIVSLGWPAMTMDFSVEDKALFKKLVMGRKVQFQFQKKHNQYVVTGVK